MVSRSADLLLVRLGPNSPAVTPMEDCYSTPYSANSQDMDSLRHLPPSRTALRAVNTGWVMRAFILALSVAPLCLADPVKAERKKSTAAAKSTAKKKTAAKRTRTATLRFKLDKPGYHISINGRPIGISPLPGAWSVPAGKHVIGFKSADGQAGSLNVSVSAGTDRELSWPQAAGASLQEVEEKSTYRWAAWSMSDVGVATAASGLVAVGVGALLGQRSLDLATQASELNIRTTYRRDFARLTDQAEGAALGANVAYGIGLVAIIGGATLAIFGDGGLFAISGDDDEGAVIIGGKF